MMYWDGGNLESQGLSKYVLSSIDNATDRILKDVAILKIQILHLAEEW